MIAGFCNVVCALYIFETHGLGRKSFVHKVFFFFLNEILVLLAGKIYDPDLIWDKQNDVLNEVDELASLRVSNKPNDRINFY